MKINKNIALAALGVVLSATALVGANENIRNAVFMTLDDVEAQCGYCVIEISRVSHHSEGSKSITTDYFHCDGHDNTPCCLNGSSSMNGLGGCTGTLHRGL